MPKIAVIMSVFNGEKYLRKAIESILGQTCKDFVLYIMDDCSTDNSIFVIKEYIDERIHFYKADKNSGISQTLNYLITKAKKNHPGIEYINIHDQDDISLPDKLKITKKFLDLPENSRYGFVGTFFDIINESGNVDLTLKLIEDNDQIKRQLFFENKFGHGSVLYRYDAMAEDMQFGHIFDSDFDGVQDYELYMRIIENGWKVANIPEVLWQWRRWQHNHGNKCNQAQLFQSVHYKYYCDRIGIEFKPCEQTLEENHD